ncbi:MAG: LicD family protein [Massilibacteroides sp.]|nr:LicD family protein [Massilibacteroides sp.]MDD3062598.1 LicD family protein [Massilibacteroides sp.]MDD4116190.1 LicD family protein [Massilibacteroides sp.]MDD4660135.1 LicD family protein [Massilibacteroides sp.]
MADYNKLFPDRRQEGDTVLRQAQLVMLRMLCVVDDICRRHDLHYWLCSGTLLGAIRHKGFIPWDDDLDICMLREDYEKFLEIALQELPKEMLVQTRELDPLYDYLPLPCKIRDKKSLIISKGLEKKKYCMGLFIDIFPADRYHLEKKQFLKEKKKKEFFFFLSKLADFELSKDKSFSRKFISYFSPLIRLLIKQYLKEIKKDIAKNKSLGKTCLIGHGMDTPWRRFFKYSDIFPLQETSFEGYNFFVPNNAHSYLCQLYGENYMVLPPLKERVAKHSAILKPIIE